MKPIHVSQLFAIPIQSAIRAQAISANEIISFLDEFGFEDPKTRKTKNFHIQIEKSQEEQVADESTGKIRTQLKTRKIDLKIPYLGLIEPPSPQIKEMHLEFGIKLSIPDDDKNSAYDSFMGTFSAMGPNITAPIKVTMKLTQNLPEGLAKLQDALSEPSQSAP